jgi:nucleoside-diphosphate-sugar epimerase
MKVLLTGANGFVGSHLLDRLIGQAIPTVVLLRRTANRRLIAPQLSQVGVRLGSVTEPATLAPALEGVTHVIHCAARTKALRVSEFYETNEAGTHHLVEAVNRASPAIQRLILVSSLAAAGPATAAAPACEDDPPMPVSDYGRSKLAGEQVVRRESRVPFVILRPPGVYGPRDADFLQLFKAVRAHVRPQFDGGRQPLSLVYVEDLATLTIAALEHPAATGQTFNVAASEVVTAGGLARAIAEAMRTWTVPLPLPSWGLWPICVAQEAWSRLRGRPAILSRQKYREARARGWVCDVRKLRDELGFECRTTAREGMARTLAWYREQGWLSRAVWNPDLKR